jgi:hypothetical protein
LHVLAGGQYVLAGNPNSELFGRVLSMSDPITASVQARTKSELFNPAVMIVADHAQDSCRAGNAAFVTRAGAHG